MKLISHLVLKVTFKQGYNQYDLAGNVVQETLLDQAGQISYDYDLLERPISVQAPHWQEKIPSWGFDDAGNLKERHVTDNKGIVNYTYDYDSLYQLILEKGCVSHTYQNDSVYNRTAKDENPYTHNALNQILSQTNCTYEYDRNGNLIAKSAEGNQTRYVYDALDRLIEVHHGANTTTYSYDSFHRRMSKTHNGLTTSYLYQNQNEIGAVNGSKITQLRVIGITYGAEIGGAVALELDGKTYAPIHDPQGNVVALVDPSGQFVEGYRYSAFGEIQNLAELAVDNPWKFSSKRFDSETGFVYFGRRYYAPEIGRWITPDPLGFADGPNLYAYVHNHPLAYIDPDGQFAFLLVPLLISFATDMAIDLALPLAVDLATPYLGVTATTFLSGVVRGMNSDFSAASPVEAGGMSLGALVTWKKNAVKGLWKKGGALIVETTEVVAGAITKNVTKTAVHQGTNQTAHAVSQVANKSLVQAEKCLEKNGLNNAGGFSPFVGRKGWELEVPDFQPKKNIPTIIQNRQYTGHALDQMQNRGIMPSVVENTIKNGISMQGKKIGTTAFYDSINDVTVILINENNKVRTASFGLIKQ